MLEKNSQLPDPKRFDVSRSTLWFDRLMGWVIRFGGVGVILAVFGIFYFVIKEVIPLFRSSDIQQAGQVQVDSKPRVLGVDEWGEMPFFYNGGASVVFVNLADGKRQVIEIPGYAEIRVTAYAFDVVHQRVTVGLDDGRVGSFLVEYQRAFTDGGKESTVVPKVIVEPWFQVEAGTGPITQVSYGDAGANRIIAAKRGTGETSSVSILRLKMKRGLIGKGKLSLAEQSNISSELKAESVMIRASQNGQMLLCACADGTIDYFVSDSSGISKRQNFQPFPGSAPRQMDFLFGGVSIVVTAQDGRQEQWSLFRHEEGGERLFGMTKTFPALPAGDVVFAVSQRNRSFLTGAGSELSIRHSTSGSVRWQSKLDFMPVAAVVDAKGEHFVVVAEDGNAWRYAVHDPHPEAGWRAFFGKVWYEGGAEPVYQWQSNGGSDDFEPKLSLVPLIFGSLKGTAYALLFSIPIALLAAVFSAAFLPLSVKRVVKPIMEIMSSLPSVVLGFLAGMWLAPVLETRVPSVVAMVLMIPLGVFLLGYAWCRLPIVFRNRFSAGSEWMIVLPFILLVGYLGWNFGPLLESWLFIYKDPSSGKEIADFRLWWPQVTGTSFEQRNCLVLGFIMGFAVIPVIFTIAEDALSNVPKSLTAASCALGANRWQVVWTIMLPVASSGIFSALMIGFGRAVGETMIMVMATGNTPMMEWDLFNGMRTLSANIAVELPEAPVGSTHYRTLFLGAIVLFAMTFCMNTLAELLRQRLREKNRIV